MSEVVETIFGDMSTAMVQKQQDIMAVVFTEAIGDGWVIFDVKRRSMKR